MPEMTSPETATDVVVSSSSKEQKLQKILSGFVPQNSTSQSGEIYFGRDDEEKARLSRLAEAIGDNTYTLPNKSVISTFVSLQGSRFIVKKVPSEVMDSLIDDFASA